LAKSKLLPVQGDPDREKAERQFNVILHLIGQVVVAWGEMDDTLIYVLARLSGSRLKAAGITYYALDALSTRLAVIKGLAQHKLAKGFALDIPIAVGRPDANNDQHYPGETVFTGGWS